MSGVVQGVSAIGKATDAVQRFSDRILILITQIGRVGCLVRSDAPGERLHADFSQYQVATPTISASMALPVAPPLAPELAHLRLPPADPSAIVTRLLGSAPTELEEALYELYVRQIAACVYGNAGNKREEDDMPPWAGRGVIVGLALKRSDAEEEVDLSERHRKTLAGVLELVLESRVW